ncbi:MAG: hypothetical protein AAFU79_24155 [Myxococcota bacterium]
MTAGRFVLARAERTEYGGRMTSTPELESISAEDLAYYRRHPNEVHELLNRETVRRNMIGWILALAVLLVASSKLAAYFLHDLTGSFVASVVVDLVFETGAALMGAVATLLFVEIAQARQYEENKRLYRAVKAHLDAEAADPTR